MVAHEAMKERRERLAWPCVILILAILAVVLSLLVALGSEAFERPQVVSCIGEQHPAAQGPPMFDLEISSRRRGDTVEHSFLGCSWYYYEAPPFR